MSFIQYIEKYLGPISQGWKDKNSELDLQIVSFNDCPDNGCSTLISLGMSNKPIMSNDGRMYKQELIFPIYTSELSDLIISFLMSLCESILNNRKAPLRGDVIQLHSDLANRVGFEGVYCTIPSIWSDDFFSYMESTPATIIVWVIPVHKSEINYINSNGWDDFEDLLSASDVELLSLDRLPII